MQVLLRRAAASRKHWVQSVMKCKPYGLQQPDCLAAVREMINAAARINERNEVQRKEAQLPGSSLHNGLTLPPTRARSYTVVGRSDTSQSHPFKALGALRNIVARSREAGGHSSAVTAKRPMGNSEQSTVDAKSLIQLAKEVLDSSESSLVDTSQVVDL